MDHLASLETGFAKSCRAGVTRVCLFGVSCLLCRWGHGAGAGDSLLCLTLCPEREVTAWVAGPKHAIILLVHSLL